MNLRGIKGRRQRAYKRLLSQHQGWSGDSGHSMSVQSANRMMDEASELAILRARLSLGLPVEERASK